jgi:hypothetical protein
MDEHAGQHDVLDDVGKIAGMEGVAVIQAAAPFAALYRFRMSFPKTAPHFPGSRAV